MREGQTACETQTCYNSKAVSINFISIENSGKPNEDQLKTLCNFIHHFVASSHLDENYLLFRHSQLIASYQEYEEDEGYLSTKSCHLSLTKRSYDKTIQMMVFSTKIGFLLIKLQKL